MANVRTYIDGFNLYHAIAALKDNTLKWLNLVELSKGLARQGDNLEQVHFFTAILNWDHKKQQRHRNYIAALRATGVFVHEGEFKTNDRKCWAMDRFCSVREEKQTDVAIAVKMVADAMNGGLERAILVTADTDQIPTVKLVEQMLGIPVAVRFPPNRASNARDLGNQVADKREISVGLLRACRFPKDVHDASGKKVASMPSLYENP